MKDSSTLTKAEAVRAYLKIADMVVESVALAGSVGAPGTVIYLALQQSGCTLAQYEQLMGLLVDAGKVTRRGDLYFAKRS